MTNFVHCVRLLRFEEREIAKKKFYAAKKPMQIWNFNFENIVEAFISVFLPKLAN